MALYKLTFPGVPLLRIFSRQKHKPGKFVLGQFLQLFRCALRKLLYFRFHVGQGGGHCRHRISPCFLPVTADKVCFFKVELSHVPIPPIPCFCSLPPAFSGRRLQSFCPVQAAPAGTAFSLSPCRTVFRYAPLCRRFSDVPGCVSRP